MARMGHWPGEPPATSRPDIETRDGNVIRGVYFAAGGLFLVLGLIGIVVPVMPTTVFVILAAACFARSAPRVEAWLLDHRSFGPGLRAWRRHGAIVPRVKLLALGGMAAGYAVFWFSAAPGPWLAGGVATIFVAGALFVVTRPSAPGPA